MTQVQAQAQTQPFALRSLGEIAVSLPGATAIFRRHKLDFCCGGAESLAGAAKRKGLDRPRSPPSSRSCRRRRASCPTASRVSSA